MITRILSSVFPDEIDTDDQLPVIIDSITEISAFHINALKDSIIAIERALGVDPAQEFPTLKARMENIENKYVRLSGSRMTGDIEVNNSLVSRIYFGNDKNTSVLWADGTGADGVHQESRLTMTEDINAVPLVFLGTAADGTTMSNIDIDNAFISDRDIFGNFFGSTREPVEHRRIRIFDDVDVQGYWHNEWATVVHNMVIDSGTFPAIDNEYDDNALLSAGGALIVKGDVSVSGHFDALGADRVIAWAGENKPAEGMSSASAVSVKLASAELEAVVAQSLNKTYPREDVIRAAYPVGWGPVVTIPANENIKAIMVLFSTVLVGPGRALLRINSGSEIEGPEDFSGRLDWPRLENLSLYSFNAKSVSEEPIIVNDIYTVSGQAIIPVGSLTRGTVWTNGGDSAFPSTQPMIGLDHEATFDPSKDNVLTMYYDYGWTSEAQDRWRYEDGDKRVLYSSQQSQIFVYALTTDAYSFKTKRLANELNWDLLEDYFRYETLEELRAAWNVLHDPPSTEVSIGSVNILNKSTVNNGNINKNIGLFGSDITLAFEIKFNSLPDTISSGSFEISARGADNTYSLLFAKDGIYMNDATLGPVLIPGSSAYTSEGDDVSQWHIWFTDIDSDNVQVNRIYRNDQLIYDESNSLLYESIGDYDHGDVYLKARPVDDAADHIDVTISHVLMGSSLSGYGEGYDYDGYSKYGY